MSGCSWGGATKRGFLQVATAFLDNVAELKLSDGEVHLVLQILRYSWDGTLPFPSVRTLGKKAGKSPKTIQLRLRTLRAKGLLRIVRRPSQTNLYDFGPLFDKLREGIPQDLTGSTPQDLTPKEQESNQNDSTHMRPVPELLDPNEPDPPESEEDPPSDPLREKLDELAAQAREKEKRRRPKKAAHSRAEKRREKFEAKKPEQYNANDMELVFAEAYEERSWRYPPRFGGKERALMKRLIEEYGAAETARVIADVVKNWERFVGEFRLDGGYPSPAVVFGFRTSFFPRVLDGPLTEGSPGWGAHFDETKIRPESERTGWGDIPGVE